MNHVARHAMGVVFAAIFLGLSGPARAADLKELARLLAPALIAEQFTNVCATFDDKSLGRVDDVRTLAGHIQQEVLAGLPAEQAQTVVVAAANEARSLALREVHALKNAQNALVSWCEDVANAFVDRIAVAHTTAHASLDAAINLAKRPAGDPTP